MGGWGRYVPMGLKAWFTGMGITNVVEMSWWDEVRHGDSSVKVTMTPAMVGFAAYCSSFLLSSCIVLAYACTASNTILFDAWT